MKAVARTVAILLLLLLVVGQVYSLGVKEGWDAVVVMFGFVLLLFLSVWYGFMAD